MKKRFEEDSGVLGPVLIMLDLKLLATGASLIDFFKHRRKGRSARSDALERLNYSPGLILKPIDFEGLIVEAINEIFVYPVRIHFFKKFSQFSTARLNIRQEFIILL